MEVSQYHSPKQLNRITFLKIIIGKQMEKRITLFKYLAFILFAGVFTNICQYLMSVANFIGFSGILCAMIAFVWIRQKRAPWEGYQLHPSTFNFISIFILALFAIQVVSFVIEVTTNQPAFIGIANTAHLAGAAVGFALAHLKFFTWNT